VAQRCDDTVDKKRVNSCVLKHLFLEGVEQPKLSPKTPGDALSDVLLMSARSNFENVTYIYIYIYAPRKSGTFKKVAADAAKKTVLRAVF